MSISEKLSNIRWREIGRDHGLPLLLFGVLSIAVSWPAARDFTTRIVSDGGDARNNLWMLWHVKEALLGHQPWFELDLLYYPLGVNLLTRGLGPLVGFFGLPFWPLGPEAAYNGTIIITVWLTGYSMYLLARALDFNRQIAFFAGLFLLIAPIHVAGINGHMTKSFMAMMPLVLLAFIRLLDLKRSMWWALATAVILLLTLLHNGYQFVFAGLAIVFFGLAAFIRADIQDRRPIVLRGVVLALLTIVLVGPLLLAMIRASADPLVPVDANIQSVGNQPDASEFLLPASHSVVFGHQIVTFLRERGHKPAIETAVSLSWTGIFLGLIAALRVKKESRIWWVFALLMIIMAIGPSLKWLGQRTFTEYEMPLVMPYAFLTALPGFEFMRAPGRFMMIGYVPLGITAAYGLRWLTGRFRRFGPHIVLLASLLLVIEWWPHTWPQQSLRQVSDFYRDIAADPDMYGVFDLPVKPTEESSHINYAATYQIDQLVHQKGLASGYLARTYQVHPMFPCVIPEMKAPELDVLVNGEPADCTANFLYDLAYFNYRYVVLHKATPGDRYDEPDSWGQVQAAELIDRFFGEQAPLVDDELVTVYEVPDITELTDLEPTIGLTGYWYWREPEWRWARSPAVMFLSVPEAQEVVLELVTAFVNDPEAEGSMGTEGRLTITLSNGYSTTVTLHGGQTTAVPLDLEAGVYTVMLELEAGNFRPSDLGDSLDERQLGFALHQVNLVTTER